MRNFTLKFIVLIIAIFGSSQLFAQATFTDDFSAEKDYITDDFGAIWDGFYLNMSDEVDTAALKVFDTKTNPGSLTITAKSTAWAADAETGFFYYKSLFAQGADFDAKVKIVTGDFKTMAAPDGIPYFMPGLMVRAKGADVITFVQTQAFDRFDYNKAVFRQLNAPDVDEVGDESWTPRNTQLKDIGLSDVADEDFSVANFPWIRLEKVGTKVNSYVSDDGQTWYKIWTTERPDLNNYMLEVGLSHSAYSDNITTVVFDDYSVKDMSADGVSSNQLSLSQVKSFYKDHNIVVTNGSNSPLKSVKLYGVDGAVHYNIKGANESTFSIPVEKLGMYILVVENEGKTFSQKIAAY